MKIKVKKSSLQKKILISLLLAMTFSFLLSAFLTHKYTKTFIETETEEIEINLLQKCGENIEWYLNELYAATLLPYSNVMLNALLENESKTIQQTDSNIYPGLSEIMNANRTIFQVHLYSSLSHTHFLTNSGHSGRATDKEIRHNLNSEIFVIQPTALSGNYGITLFGITPKPVFTITRQLWCVPERKYLGYLNIDVSLNYLNSLLSGICSKESQEVVLLIDSKKNMIFASDNQPLPGKIDAMWFDEILISPQEHGSMVIPSLSDNRESAMLLFQKINVQKNTWIIVKCIPMKHLYHGTNMLLRQNLLIGILVIFFDAACITIITYYFTFPINRLRDNISRIRAGNMEDRITCLHSDEIGELTSHFNDMMDHINNLVIKSYRLQTANTVNQLRALQAQLDPHFLNNAIQSIGAHALQSGAKDVYCLIANLGKMLHYCMDIGTIVVPMKSELEYTSQYLELQKERFGERLQYTIKVDNNASDVQIPKMLLQPIVENSFKHGFKQSNSINTIYINVFKQDAKLIVSVEDNGVGMPEDVLNALTNHIQTQSATLVPNGSENIGLKNLGIRLDLYYGSRATLNIGNLSSGGFFTHIMLPIQMEDSIESFDCR